MRKGKGIHKRVAARKAAAPAAQRVVQAAERFVQHWIAHPRDVQAIGSSHAELIREVLNYRNAVNKP